MFIHRCSEYDFVNMSYRITSSGQVSIPAKVRRRWGTRRVEVEDHGDYVVVRPAADDPIAAAFGAFKDRMGISSDEARALARREDAEIEARKWGRG